jgi:hypothetical protein
MGDDFFDQAKEEFEKEDQESYAETWRPEAGDYLEGIVVRGGYVLTSTSDTPVHLVVVKDRHTNEDYTVWCSATMLKNHITDLAPAVGARIVIQYEGKFPTKSGDRTYGKFHMKTDATDFDYWHGLVSGYMNKAKLMAEEGVGNPYPSQSAAEKTSIGPDEDPF